eukprot:4537491-Prymnesium_polylepis.1
MHKHLRREAHSPMMFVGERLDAVENQLFHAAEREYAIEAAQKQRQKEIEAAHQQRRKANGQTKLTVLFADSAHGEVCFDSVDFEWGQLTCSRRESPFDCEVDDVVEHAVKGMGLVTAVE